MDTELTFSFEDTDIQFAPMSDEEMQNLIAEETENAREYFASLED